MIETTHHRHISGTPAELLAIEGMYETSRDGYLLGLHVSPGNEVITSYVAGEPVTSYAAGEPAALVVFVEYEDLGEIWVHFGYCRPAYRRKGYYRACIERLREIAKARGYSRIHTAAAPDNNAAIASIEARGGTLQYVGFTFPV